MIAGQNGNLFWRRRATLAEMLLGLWAFVFEFVKRGPMNAAPHEGVRVTRDRSLGRFWRGGLCCSNGSARHLGCAAYDRFERVPEVGWLFRPVRKLSDRRCGPVTDTAKSPNARRDLDSQRHGTAQHRLDDRHTTRTPQLIDANALVSLTSVGPPRDVRAARPTLCRTDRRIQNQADASDPRVNPAPPSRTAAVLGSCRPHHPQAKLRPRRGASARWALRGTMRFVSDGPDSRIRAGYTRPSARRRARASPNVVEELHSAKAAAARTEANVELVGALQERGPVEAPRALGLSKKRRR